MSDSVKATVLKDEELDIGLKVRHLRIRKGLTLKQLAAIIDCSDSLLSKIENHRTNPSLGMVKKIATALGVNIGDLYTSDSDLLRIVSRADGRPLIRMGQTDQEKGFVLERLIPFSDQHLLQGSIHHIPPGFETDGPLHTEGEKFGYVLLGEIELRVGDQIFVVREGDSFCFRSKWQHSYRNRSGDVARVLWLNTPPNF